MWKIVIVEDEDMLREGLIKTIKWETYGFEITGDADNGEKGLKLVYELQPDVVITDIRMPVMDGLTMSEKIHEWKEDIRIVFISGYDEFEYARRAMKMGADEYILKPVKLAQVEELLAQLAVSLREEEAKKSEYSKLKEIESIGTGEIRQRLYQTLLTDKELPPQLLRYEELLSEEEKNQYYCVMVVGQKDFPTLTINADYLDMREQDHAFGKTIRDRLGDLPVTVLHSSLCERILVFRNPEIQKIRSITQNFEQELARMTERPLVFHFSTGTPYRTIRSICKSYGNAIEKMQQLYLDEWADQFVEEKGSEKTDFINYDKKVLLSAIQSGNSEKVEEACDLLEEKIVDQNVMSQLQMILLITSIFEQLVHLSDGLGNSGEITGRNPMEDFKRIVARGQRAQILQNFRSYCLDLTDRFQEINGHGQGNAQSYITRAMEYIRQEHSNPELVMGDVAQYVYISTSYLTMLLKKETGKTFVEYLTDVRMEHACQLLSQTDMKSYHVAEVCGFANPTYFSTVFKSIYGVTPTVYRKEHQLITE